MLSMPVAYAHSHFIKRTPVWQISRQWNNGSNVCATYSTLPRGIRGKMKMLNNLNCTHQATQYKFALLPSALFRHLQVAKVVYGRCIRKIKTKCNQSGYCWSILFFLCCVCLRVLYFCCVLYIYLYILYNICFSIRRQDVYYCYIWEYFDGPTAIVTTPPLLRAHTNTHRGWYTRICVFFFLLISATCVRA